MSHLTQHCFGALVGALAVMALQGCKGNEGVTARAPESPSSLAYVEDSVLTSRVRAALDLSPVLNSGDIGVETHHGVVLLSGTAAADLTQMDMAAFVAQTVPGVASVNQRTLPQDTAPAATDMGTSVGLRSVGDGHWRGAISLDADRAIARGAPFPVENPAVLLSHPLPQEVPPFAYTPPPPSRWVTFAHSVLGIRSIQDELLIKR